MGEWARKGGKELGAKASRGRKSKCRSAEEEGAVSFEGTSEKGDGIGEETMNNYGRTE